MSQYGNYKSNHSLVHLQEVNKAVQSLVGSKITFGKTETKKMDISIISIFNRICNRIYF